MKILIYATDFGPSIGGVESVVLALARGLARQPGEIDVTVATRTAAGSATGSAEDRELPFRIVRRPTLPALVRLVRESDIVHLAGPSLLPLLLSLLLRKPVAVEHHGFQAICPNGQLFYEPGQMPCPGHFMAGRHRECWKCNAKYGWLTSLKLWLLTFPRRWLSRLATANIAPTTWLSSLLQLSRASTICHGVRERPPSPHRSFQEPLTFVFMGRLVSTKGVHILLQATERLRKKGLSFRVKIIGDGPERRALEEAAKALGLGDAVSFLGYLRGEKTAEVLDEATAIVMPSLGGEVFGLVAAENMMQGRLLIVSDIGSLAEVVGPAGLRFKAGDPEGLANCLESVLRSPRLAVDLGQRARGRSLEFFREQRMIDDHIRLYHKVLSDRGVRC